MRVLDRFEEILIIVLMAAATILIFVAVTQRYSLDVLASLVRASRGWDIAWISDSARAAYGAVRSINLVWAQEACIRVTHCASFSSSGFLRSSSNCRRKRWRSASMA